MEKLKAFFIFYFLFFGMLQIEERKGKNFMFLSASIFFWIEKSRGPIQK